VAQDQTERAAQALITGGAALLLGSGASALSYPGSAAAELAQIPYIELNAPADGIMTRGFKFLLRTGPTTTMIAAAAIGVIDQRYAAKKIGLLFNTGATAGAIAAAALAAWRQAKTPPLLSVGYPADAADLAEPVSRLKRAGAELILHAADAADVLLVNVAMQNLGWKPTIIGCGDGFLLRETAYALGPMFDGTIVVGAPFYAARAAYIATAYSARYGMGPRAPDSLTAFVGAKLVFDKLNAVGGDPTALLAALQKTDIPAGTLANGFGVAFDKTGQNTRSFASVQQWKGGALVALP
jgi:branched-chain amino acid transport system substrate-binding protein